MGRGTGGTPHLRLVRDPDPLASYIRPLARDLNHTARLIASGHPVGDGLIVDACDPSRSEDLRQLAREAGTDLVLDPRSVELSTPGGRQRAGIIDLPWAAEEIDIPDGFGNSRQAEVAERIAETCIDFGLSSVLAPTHYHESFPSPWFEIDIGLARLLRTALDETEAGKKVRVYFPLISKLSALLPEFERRRVIERLSELADEEAIDAIWVRMHGFGSTQAGPLNLKRYVELGRELHAAGVPLVAERTGTIGVALLAFGVTAGIESSITHGERYNVRSLMKTSSGKKRGFTIQPRVYLPEIGAFMKREPASDFLNTRNVKNWFACQESCCERGIVDMLAEPRRHFLVNRSREVESLARVPEEARVAHYFDTWLRLASDRATRAARIDSILLRQRDRLDQWRATLSEIRDRDADSRPSVSKPVQRVPPRRVKPSHSDQLSLS